jgi:hypothetical protein
LTHKPVGTLFLARSVSFACANAFHHAHKQNPNKCGYYSPLCSKGTMS